MHLYMVVEALGLLVFLGVASSARNHVFVWGSLSPRMNPKEQDALVLTFSLERASCTPKVSCSSRSRPWPRTPLISSAPKNLLRHPMPLHKVNGQRSPVDTLRSSKGSRSSAEIHPKWKEDSLFVAPHKGLKKRAFIERLLHEIPGYNPESAIAPMVPAMEANVILGELSPASQQNHQELEQYRDWVAKLNRKYLQTDASRREMERLSFSMVSKVKDMEHHGKLCRDCDNRFTYLDAQKWKIFGGAPEVILKTRQEERFNVGVHGTH